MERQAGSLSDIEERRLTVGKIQNPQHCELTAGGIQLTAKATVQSAASQLRLAFRAQIDVSAIAFENVHDADAGVQRPVERRTGDEPEIVRGGVVLGVLPVRQPHQTSNGQVETR